MSEQENPLEELYRRIDRGGVVTPEELAEQLPKIPFSHALVSTAELLGILYLGISMPKDFKFTEDQAAVVADVVARRLCAFVAKDYLTAARLQLEVDALLRKYKAAAFGDNDHVTNQ